jgi:arylsulfatase A-like enzyme
MILFTTVASGQTKPNIVLILADDLGYGCTGPYGAPASVLQTPAIDSLAKAGCKFINAYAPASLCSPTRYAILTGRYYWRDVRDWGIIQSTDPCVIPPTGNNIAARLKKEGYNTAGIGKWHLGYNKTTKDYSIPDDIGFDYWHDYRVGPDGNRLDKEDTRIAEYLNNETNQWIDKQSSDTPFFLYFAPIAIHTPIIPGIEYQGKSNGGAYGDYIMELDGSVGNIIEALERNGFTENTIVIFTSDNGGVPGAAKEAREAGLKVNGDYRGTKLSIFEGGFRVPFIIKWINNIAPGTTSTEKVSLVDIYASIGELLNIDLQSPAVEAGDSYSFYPAWFDDLSKPIRDNMILTSHEGITAIHSGGWKYIDGTVREPAPYAFFGDSRQAAEAHEQLYDIVNDPYETRDLVNDSTEKVIDLSNLLQHLRNLGYSRTFNGIETHAKLPILSVNSNVKVYPNPSSAHFTVEISDLDVEYDILISDSSGRSVAKIQNCNTNMVNFHRKGLENGVYFYQIVNGNEILGSGKIILE